MSEEKREKGWGKQQRDARRAKVERERQVIKEDYNEPFVHHPPKPKPTKQHTDGSASLSGALVPSTTVPSSGGQAAPTQAKAKVSECIHASLVRLFEHQGMKKPPQAYGPKGAALLHSPSDDTFALLLYAPVTRKHEIQMELPINFNFAILPSLFATFMQEEEGRYWSFQFNTAEDLTEFARHVALIKDYRINIKNGGRQVITQDLTPPMVDSRAVQVGDTVKVRYTMYASSATHPKGLGETLGMKEPKRFVVGAGTQVAGLEEGLVGMKKKGQRFIVIPASMTEAAIWGPMVAAGTTICIEVTVLSVRAPGDKSSDKDGKDNKQEKTASDNKDSKSNSKKREKKASMDSGPGLISPSGGSALHGDALAVPDFSAMSGLGSDHPLPSYDPQLVLGGGAAITPHSVPASVPASTPSSASFPTVATPSSSVNSTTTSGVVPAPAPASGASGASAGGGGPPPAAAAGGGGGTSAGTSAGAGGAGAVSVATVVWNAGAETVTADMDSTVPPKEKELPSLKTRMRLLAEAQGIGAAGLRPALHILDKPSAGGRLAVAATSAPRERKASEGTSDEDEEEHEPPTEIEALLTDLAVTDLRDKFRQEGIKTIDELLALDAADLKELIPQMGARVKVLTRARERAEERKAHGPPLSSHQVAPASQSSSTPSLLTPSSKASKSAPANSVSSASSSSLASSSSTVISSAPSSSAPSSSSKAHMFLLSGGLDDSVASDDPRQRRRADPAVETKPQQSTQAPAHVLDKERRRPTLDTEEFSPGSDSQRKRASAERSRPKETNPIPAGKPAQADLEAEYERGKNETVQLARDKIEQIRAAAKTRMAELQNQLDASTTKNTDDISKAKEIITKLRDETRKAQEDLAKAVDEKEALVAKSRQYVQQVRESKQDEQTKAVKQAMEKVYTKLGTELGANEIYDGKQVLTLIRNAIKECLKEYGVA